MPYCPFNSLPFSRSPSRGPAIHVFLVPSVAQKSQIASYPRSLICSPPDDLETKMGMGWTQVTGWSFYYHIKLYLKITLLCRLICRLFKVPCFSSFPRSRLWHVTQRSQDHCPRLQKFLRSSRSTAKMAALSGKHSILTILRNNRGLWIV